MDKKTYESLKRIVRIAKGNHGVSIDSYSKDFKQVENWINEVAKEYTEEEREITPAEAGARALRNEGK